MTFHEWNRLFGIIRIILRYGLFDFIPEKILIFPFKIKGQSILKIFNQYNQLSLGERFRLSLQELGPIWIKFGQMLSTRSDILSNSVAEQLTMLQDRVQPFDGSIARMHIEKAIGNSLETCFKDFQEIPLASASIAQVHPAKLKKDGTDVVIKVIRPGILSIITTDIKLMYKLANWIYTFYPKGQKFKFPEIILEYKRILLNELNLLKETANAIQLRRNFKFSNILYIPKVYVNFCSKNVMVMERIYGIPIYNINMLKKNGINMKLLAERGIEIFFTQVFRDSFFHGDMHPGNIFISYKNPKNPKYISVDCGIVGSLNQQDKYYLALNFIAFFNRDYRKIAELHLDSGWIPINTNIEEFEYAMRTVFEPIFERPLQEIPFSSVLLHLFNIAQYFHMEIQPQLILLQKTLLYIEDIVRQLYPHFNLWKSAKPFLEKWVQEQLKLSHIICTLKNKMPFWINKIPELPLLILSNNIKYSDTIYKKIDLLSKELKIQRTGNTQALFLFGIGSLSIISGMLWIIINKKIDPFPVYYLFTFGICVWIIGWKKMT